MHAVVRNSNSKHFRSNAKSFQITLQLHCSCILSKITSLKRNRLSLSEKQKAVTEVESGTMPSKVTEKYNVPRNTISTWLLPGKKKEKITVDF